MAYFEPTFLANSFSILSTYFPTLDTKVVLIQSFKYCFSLPINLGSCKGINSFVLVQKDDIPPSFSIETEPSPLILERRQLSEFLCPKI